MAQWRGGVEYERYDLVAPGRLERVCDTLPALRPTWARVRIAYCGVCGTDVSFYRGQRRPRYPLSLGHELVAVVEAVGPEVVDIQPGDVVTSDLNFRCGRCQRCRAGRSHLCEQGQASRFTNRGFSTRLNLDGRYLHRCGGEPAPQLALAEPLSCALHAYARAQVSPDDRVLVVGAGGIGICMAFQLARVVRHPDFEVVDTNAARLARLEPLIGPGGVTVSNPAGDYDVVLEVSGSEDGLRLGCELVKPGGRICTMSHLPPTTCADFVLDLLARKDVTLLLSYLNGERHNLANSVDALSTAWNDKWRSLLDVQPLEALPNALAGRSLSPANKVIIDLGWSAAHQPV